MFQVGFTLFFLCRFFGSIHMRLSRRRFMQALPLGVSLFGSAYGAVDFSATALASELPSALLTGRNASAIEHRNLISRVLSKQILFLAPDSQISLWCREYALTIRHESVEMMISLIRSVPELQAKEGLWEAYARSVIELREKDIIDLQQLDDTELLTSLTGRGSGDFQGIPGVDLSCGSSEGRFYAIGPKSVQYGLYAPYGEKGLALRIRGYEMTNCFSHLYTPTLKGQDLPKQYPFDQGQFSKELLRFLDCAVGMFGEDFWGFTEYVQQFPTYRPLEVPLRDLAVAEPLAETGTNQLIYNCSQLLSAAHEILSQA
jgi:hypothetical protein